MIICSIIVIPTINFIFIALSPTDFWDVHYENKEEKKKKGNKHTRLSEVLSSQVKGQESTLSEPGSSLWRASRESHF